MPRVVHFEIPVNNLEAAAEFYRTVFGWKIQKWDGPVEYWMIDTGEDGPGINGGLLRRQDPAQPVVNTVGVEDLDATLAQVTAAGGKIALPRMGVPGVGWLAYIMDPEGNISGVMQPDPSATFTPPTGGCPQAAG